MRKILFVITQGEMGGAQRYVLDLATQLANNPPQSPLKIRGEEKGGYETVVAVGREKSALKAALEKKSVKVYLLRHLVRNINPIRDVLAIFELKKLIKTWQPDIVHLNSGKAGFIGSIAAALAGNKNVIFTAHGFTFLEPNPWYLRLIYLWAEKIAKPFRKKIICVSEYDRQAALKYKIAEPEQVVTIHNGVNLQKSTPPQSPPYQGGEREGEIQPPTSNLQPPIIIGTIANLYPTKGIKYLIDAAHILTTSYQLPATFVVIGDGPERKKLHLQLTTYNLQRHITLLGYVPEASTLLRDFNIFVLPSIKEGFPYTILEAMAAGLPIVATAVGGVPEAITPYLFLPLPSTKGEGKGEIERGSKATGILVEPKNPQALAQAISGLINDPALAKTLGRNARERVKKFTLERMLQKTEEVYSRA